jgi:hypothetical protein
MFALHPLAPVLTPLVVWVFGKGVLKAALGDPPWLDRLPRVPRWASVTLLVAFVYSGRFPCFFGGFSSRACRSSSRRVDQPRPRESRGRITSSMKPSSAAL